MTLTARAPELIPPHALDGWQAEIDRADEFERRLHLIRTLHAETTDEAGLPVCQACGHHFPCITDLIAAGAIL